MRSKASEIDALLAWEDRALSPEEFAARVAAPWSESEAEDFAALVEWFNRRYPTVAARLQSTRRLMAQWDRAPKLR